MIVQCEKCKTKFNVDESRIKDDGSKVRCSNCRHVFLIHKPVPEPAPPQPARPAPPEQEPAAKVKREPEPPAEESEPDLSELEAELGMDLGLSESGADEDLDLGELEADLGLNDDLAGLEEAGPAREEQSLAGEMEAGDLEKELGLDEDLGLEPPGAEAPAAEEPELEKDLDLGQMEDGLKFDQELGLKETGAGKDFDLAEDLGDLGLGEEEAAPPDREAGLEVEEEEEMDLRPPARKKPAGYDQDLEPEEDILPGKAEEEEEEDLEEMPMGPGIREEAGEVDIGEPGPVVRRKGRGLPWLLIIVLILLTGGAAAYYFQPDLIAPLLKPLGFETAKVEKPVEDPQGNKYISPEDARHFFRQNEVEGQVLVITGLAKNHYRTPRSYIRLTGLLHDAKNKVLARKQVYCGNILAEEELTKLPAAEINKKLNVRGGQKGENMNIQPGQSVKFMIVFEKIPPDLTEYTVEVAGSEAGETKK
ncbi:MAG: DUF3426 domain-containing protein [Thermodesulfobacteriota bacterium]